MVTEFESLYIYQSLSNTFRDKNGFQIEFVFIFYFLNFQIKPCN